MVPTDRRYSTKHIWLQLHEEMFTLGVTEYLIRPVKNILYVDLADVEDPLFDTVAAGEIEHLDGVIDIYPPGNCTVMEVNTKVIDEPDLLLSDPYGKGWLLRVDMDNPEVYDTLMNAHEYESYAKSNLARKKEEEGRVGGND